VLRGGERVLDDDGVVDVSPERRDRIEVERATRLRVTARGVDDDQPAERRSGLAGGRA
jgi:hypothetical protein